MSSQPSSPPGEPESRVDALAPEGVVERSAREEPGTPVAQGGGSRAWCWRARLREVLDPRAHGPLLLLCLALVALGCVLRGYRLADPGHMTWDEDHFVVNARNYLAGAPDVNDHPPLGKLILAVPMRLLGDHGLAWRIAPCILGMGNVLLAFLLGLRAFGPRAGLIAAAFLAGDGMFTAYSRCALLDGMLSFFVLASFAAAFRADSAWRLALAGALGGCAAAIKFTGVVTAVPLLLTVWTQRKRLPRWALFATATLPAAYLFWYGLGLGLTGKPWTPAAVVADSLRLVRQHAGANQRVHPSSSYWYTWFLPTEPITLRYLRADGDRVRGLTTLGNPLLWWGALVALFAALARGARAVWAGLRAGRAAGTAPVTAAATPAAAEARAGLWLFLCWLLPMVPWMISSRDSYVYHYLPSYGFALVALAGAVEQVYRRRHLAGLALVAAVVLVAAFYAPVAGQLEITHLGWRQRLFLPLWD